MNQKQLCFLVQLYRTVSGVTSTHVGLGNVTNESKATMLSPTFTGTVSGVTSTHVGLGNVTMNQKPQCFLVQPLPELFEVLPLLMLD